ncbi:MAG TPA: NAD-dependent epimerase/dehydratase family protein, partial [Pseudomonadaceae bacterium]|nr:NAD-dependent epimerase/dehydratase family protein [Pseudomonadaceae bacterium]
MKVLLTGAGGYIGTALIAHLQALPADSGVELSVLYRNRVTEPDSAEASTELSAEIALKSGVRVLHGDLRDAAVCEQACAGQDVIVHLAGQAHVTGRGVDHQRNTLGLTMALAEAAMQQGVRRFIHISSSKAHFPRHSAYARAKREAEEQLLALHHQGKLEVTCLRPALVYGPAMRGNLRSMMKVLLRRRLLAFPASNLPLGMIGLDDCCRALVTALQTPTLDGHCWDLNDGGHYSLDILVQELRKRAGLARPWLRLPPKAV